MTHFVQTFKNVLSTQFFECDEGLWQTLKYLQRPCCHIPCCHIPCCHIPCCHMPFMVTIIALHWSLVNARQDTHFKNARQCRKCLRLNNSYYESFWMKWKSEINVVKLKIWQQGSLSFAFWLQLYFLQRVNISRGSTSSVKFEMKRDAKNEIPI